jgi:TRAP-type C4-dicarboxylate transport system substrate-binding protein
LEKTKNNILEATKEEAIDINIPNNAFLQMYIPPLETLASTFVASRLVW